MSAQRTHSPVNQDEQGHDGLASLHGPCEDVPSNDSPYALSSLDHNPLGINVTFLLSFHAAQPEEGIRVLEDGIKQLLKVHPFLAGDVTRQTECSQRTNTWQIEPDAPESLLKTPMLQTRYCPANSIKELESKRLLTGAEEQEIMRQLAPLPIDMDLALPRRPVLRFQANIMRDGVILAMTFHHAAMDGAGAARALGLLADYCRDPASSLAGVIPDRQLRSQIDSLAAGCRSGASRVDFSQHYCGLGDWAALLAENWPGFLQARATELVTWRLTIPGSKVQYLKAACNALLQGQTSALAGRPTPTILSNNDIVSALMAIILRQAGQLAGQSTELSIAVDMRGNFQAPAFNNYLGNMVLLTYTPIPARKDQALVDGPLPPTTELPQEYLEELTRIAARIRQSLLDVNAEYIQGVLSHLHSQTDWAKIGFRGVPIPLSSFRNFEIFGLDFGESLGSQPRGFQLHLPVLGGMCFILPKRQDSTEPWDLHLTLNRDDVSIVANDPLFRWAAGEHL
ncbi:acetyltransferase, putative [Aspergillus lentulus]|uniref:Acetyltransferase, putative n=1 Tax=Aspergillus lentulus TaxID=293939 RepID=A0ABQ1AYW1_ASPLE|nr:acetyltransferase, putative [Aspergillus lentulus]GFF90567.1 acetyltransferase, putative [Aspergillus lentulus]